MIASSLVVGAAGADITLASFGADDATFRAWKQQNDPVMGGKSSGTFSVSGEVGTMKGTVADVPSLGAPGFIKATASASYADVSSCTGISLELQSTSNPDPYAGYRLSLGNDASACGKFFARGFKANFAAPSGQFGTVQIPFEEFTRCWDDATGDAIKTCAEDSTVCISSDRKQKLQSLSVWAEGKLGDVQLDIKSVKGYGCGSGFAAPPTVNIVELAESVADLSTLVSAVVAADLADTLSSPGPFTVFAPTNEGFAALPEGTLDTLMKPENKAQLVDILTYHVLPEQVLSTDLTFFQRAATVEGKNLHVLKTSAGVHVGPDLHNLRKVVGADNLATNGVAHIIDGVMLPPANLGADRPNIVELAESVADLSTLVSAVVAADLADTLSSPGPFTVFAPTNEGFAALPEGTLDTLMKPENKAQLVDILTYHVLPEQVLSTDLKFFQRVATVEGKNLHVLKTGAGVHVGPDLQNLRKVVGADNLASNGVAHIIDGVMLPPADHSDIMV
jgi:transforming growth factor-beta-induced protein